MKLEDAKNNIGRIVVRTDRIGKKEEGIITSVNSYFVFVRYRHQQQDSWGQATIPEELELLRK